MTKNIFGERPMNKRGHMHVSTGTGIFLSSGLYFYSVSDYNEPDILEENEPIKTLIENKG